MTGPTRVATIIVTIVVFKQLFFRLTLVLLLEMKISFRIFSDLLITGKVPRSKESEYLPIGSHKNKFIFRSQNLLIHFKNFPKRKRQDFPEFWGSFRKFILRNKEFSSHMKVLHVIFLDFVIRKSCAYCKPIFLQI